MNHYEQSALLFYSEKNFFMSYNLFLEAVRMDKENTMFWYGLGDSICGYSNQNKIQKLYPLGISCIKKSFEINPENKYSSSMLERMKNNPSIGEEFISKLKIVSFEEIEKVGVDISNEKLIENFQKLKSVDNKIKAIMHLGETKNPKFAALLEHCILNEENQTIRFAALKRIGFYQNDMDLKPMFDSIIANNKVEENEPYFSLAAGGINKDWAKEIHSKFQEKLEKNDVDLNKLNSLMQDEMLYMNLSMLFLGGTEELKTLIRNDKRKEIGDKISLYMKPNVVNDLKQKEIMDEEGRFTSLGIALLNKYLQMIESSQVNKKEEIKKSPKKEITPKTSEKKKWWKLW